MLFQKFLLFLIILSSVLFVSCDEQIIVHVVPHSHDDAGWLSTFDEYYYGINTRRCVKCILDNTLISLLTYENRTFVEVEIAFFSKWYNSLSDERKSLVKILVASGRWEFANAGWVMSLELSQILAGRLILSDIHLLM